MSLPIADDEPPISMLLSAKGDNKDYFKLLDVKEKKYAHYMSKASQFGTRITLRQVSIESELIFDLLLFVQKNLDSNLINDQYKIEYKDYLNYASQFLSNLGNYKSFGDTKFIPNCSKEFLVDSILKNVKLDVHDSKVWEQFTNEYYNSNYDYKSHFKTLNDLIDQGIYGVNSNNLNLAQLGYPSLGFKSSYYSGNSVSSDDMILLKKEIFTKFNILPENTRIEKINDKTFIIHVASFNMLHPSNPSNEYPSGSVTVADDTVVSFKFGDHSREMQGIIKNLKLAKMYVANEVQSQMLDKYIEHFETGSGNAHKESQKLWVTDISPTIETNIGFIETYREPSGIIGEYEALVAIQNKERTAKFGEMVENAKEFILLLPWGAEYEKPDFNPPDFTSLEVLTFTGSGIPAGINIPNYDDVRLTIGFKNVSLGNILNASAKSSSKFPPSFIQEKDLEVFKKYQSESFEVQVGIHELLGHGTGKLLSEIDDNKYNFDFANLPIGLNGKAVTTYYKKGETWGSKFGSLAGAFEECRAELVAMYLITNRKLLEIFGFKTKEEQNNIIFAGFLQMARAGILALEYCSPETGKWGQPHMQARFSIMKTFLKHSSSKQFLKIVLDNETNPTDFHLEMDASLIETVGHECVKDYLLHLHIYKCSGDAENGTKYFIERSTVPEDLARLRDIVIKKRLPRRQFIQPNTVFNEETNDIIVKEYDETATGMIQSFIERET
ncbi:hypothetical protein TPHA_0P00610 [Tetrapisispora phaffii CBS 4417]|uniref:Dipeptidyl peptidase 3 n=1 Tax=Tetrapisispora phaffii (strain ATCC 24235 / CBS 4417 / NBRC 1672 / NRRL Y-8282 / UCD 70-5) TaxID=1071381 RepID=G8C241_TETPH|nr:hypothetical protein TPHA_0P00610 [Tetrapisispora phaffii CBS 4417]CCE66219.1 hypothetical protein TPHA_0P00610 [Tetrapisispora phaffii CBS 4417]